MFLRLKKRLGVPGMISVIALVFAMAGGAWAAGTLTSKEKKEVKKIAKQVAKPGPQGPQGPAGATGPAGAAGQDGAPGINGVSPAGSDFSGVRGPCTEGGVEYKGINTSFVCNGEEGEPGAPGSPWVVGAAPSGAILKGTWSLPPYSAAAAEETLFIPISTGVPVPVGPEGLLAVLAPDTACPGSAEEPQPATAPGTVCLYPAVLNNIEPEIFLGASKLRKSGGGLVVRFKTAAAGVAQGYGSWALKTP